MSFISADEAKKIAKLFKETKGKRLVTSDEIYEALENPAMPSGGAVDFALLKSVEVLDLLIENSLVRKEEGGYRLITSLLERVADAAAKDDPKVAGG